MLRSENGDRVRLDIFTDMGWRQSLFFLNEVVAVMNMTPAQASIGQCKSSC